MEVGEGSFVRFWISFFWIKIKKFLDMFEDVFGVGKGNVVFVI